jgi:hypothetical protein
MKLHPALTRITAALVLSTFVPAVTLTSVILPARAVAAGAKSSQALMAVVQFVSNDPSNPGSFVGSFTPTGFSVVNGVLMVTGTLMGTVTTPSNGTQTLAPQTITAPVANLDPSCTILDLTLGPLHLNLLGLVVDLNQVHLTITAVTGAGNLLGNLLCAVANLLNGSGGSISGILASLADLLNQILAAV